MKKLWLSILLSILIPGLGHIYIKKFKPGISFILSACMQLIHPSFTLYMFCRSPVTRCKDVKRYKIVLLPKNVKCLKTALKM